MVPIVTTAATLRSVMCNLQKLFLKWCQVKLLLHLLAQTNKYICCNYLFILCRYCIRNFTGLSCIQGFILYKGVPQPKIYYFVKSPYYFFIFYCCPTHLFWWQIWDSTTDLGQELKCIQALGLLSEQLPWGLELGAWTFCGSGRAQEAERNLLPKPVGPGAKDPEQMKNLSQQFVET